MKGGKWGSWAGLSDMGVANNAGIYNRSDGCLLMSCHKWDNIYN